jgi:hypothetical protein
LPIASLVAAALAFAVRAAEPAAAPAPVTKASVARERHERAAVVRATVPGRIVAWAPARTSRGTRILILSDPAVEPAPAPVPNHGGPPPLPPCPQTAGAARVLHAFDLDAPSSIERIAELPAEASDVDAADTDGDGEDELLVVTPGRVSVLADDGHLTPLFDHEGARGGGLHPAATRPGGVLPPWTFERWGAIALVGQRADGTWGELAAAPLAVRGYAEPHAIGAYTVGVGEIGRAADGTRILGAPPEEVDLLRLHTHLVRLHPDGTTSVEECWARLPAPERLTDWAHLLVDGEPWLVVLTAPADAMSLFGDRGLRVFRLAADRSRLGRAPLLATRTASTILQKAVPAMLDADGDGDRDLVLAYHRGLIDGEVAVEVFLRGEGSTFDGRPRRTAFDVKGADESFLTLEHDFDGDGVSDLLLRTEGGFRVHAGERREGGRDIVERDAIELPALGAVAPGREVYVTSVGGAGARSLHPSNVAVVDLDGEAPPEIVTVEAGGGAAGGTLSLLRIARDEPAPRKTGGR